MSYDPDPRRRRRSRVPPQLRAWVYGRRRKRYDPARRKRRIRGKPYGVGKRGGVYWSGGTKPRYDPARRRRFGRVRGYMGKVTSFLDKSVPYLAGFTGFFAGKIGSIQDFYDKQGLGFDLMRDIRDYFIGSPSHMWLDFTSPKIDKIPSKLLDPSHPDFKNHAPLFWGGIAMAIISKLPIPYLSKAIKKVIGKAGVGLVGGSVLGVIFDWHGCTPEEYQKSLSKVQSGNTPTSTTTTNVLAHYG